MIGLKKNISYKSLYNAEELYFRIFITHHIRDEHCQPRGLLLQMNRDPINVVNDDLHCEVLEACQRKNYMGKDTPKDPIFITGARVAVKWEDRG